MFITQKRRYSIFNQRIYEYTSSGLFTWTAPVGATRIKVDAWGSGENGRTTHGGSGSSYSGLLAYNVVGGQSYSVYVAPSPTASVGATGSATYFNNTSTLLALGGGQSGSNIGDISYLGGKGGISSYGGVNDHAGGGGGGSAFTSSNGSNGENATYDGLVLQRGQGGSGTGNGGVGEQKTPSYTATDGFYPGGGGGGSSIAVPTPYFGIGGAGKLTITIL